MSKELVIYARMESREYELAHIYFAFHERFKNNPEVAKFWSEAALDEMQHGGILRFCREHGNLTAESIEDSTCEHIESLLQTVATVSRRDDLTMKEAFYASLLIEASEIDEVYSKLTRGLMPRHAILYEAIQANLRSHHEAFAEAADRFLGDPAFVEAFRNLSRRRRS
jgi:hypothetical protein